MQYVNLGRTGLRVSRLCLGTMNFGWRTEEPESFAIMAKALDLGIQFFDSADVYGGKKHEAVTEQIVGRWLSESPARRDQVVLATKFQGSMGNGPNDRGASAFHIRAACDASLRRLKTDRIDLYQMHHVNRDTPWDEVYQAFETLVAQGKVLYFGSSNFGGWHIARACEQARHRNFLGLVSEQSKYSLLTRHIELEVLPACAHYGLAVIPWSPLESGILAGSLDNTATNAPATSTGHPFTGQGARRADERVQKLIAALRPQLEQWEALCKKLGHPPADVALAWTLHHPAITAPIIGPRTMEQLTASLRALEIKLAEETITRLEEIFPAVRSTFVNRPLSDPVRNEAPEAYAW